MNQFLSKNNNSNNYFWGQLQISICHQVMAKIYSFYRHNRGTNKQYYRSLKSFFKELNPEFSKLSEDKQNFYFNYIEHYKDSFKQKYLEDIKNTLNFCWRTFTLAIEKLQKSGLNIIERKWDHETKRLVWILPFLKNENKKVFWIFLANFKCWKSYQKRLWPFFENDNGKNNDIYEWEPPPEDDEDDQVYEDDQVHFNW